MKEELIADLWTLVVGHIPEKHRETVASDFINTLLDYGIKESTIQGLVGVDVYLDAAINYATDGEELADDDEDYYEDDE